MANENDSFQFTYSAQEQQELRRIREKYVPKEESLMEQIRRLDESVTKRGTVLSLVTGVVSALILGTGMSCCMVWGGNLFVPGVLIGIAGLAGVSLTYPLYQRITRKERERIAPEILRLTEQLLR